MADDDARASLEPPRLFGRRKARPAPDPEPEPVDEAPEFSDTGHDEPVPETAPEPDAEPAATRTVTRRLPRPVRQRDPDAPPLLTGRPAALVSGLVVGVFVVALTRLGLFGCEAVRGTSSCGAGPGLAALIAILALAVVAGRYLLAAFDVPDPAATSFLAVALTGVIALLFLVDVLDTWPMAIVIPAVSAGAYLLSWWVTTTFTE